MVIVGIAAPPPCSCNPGVHHGVIFCAGHKILRQLLILLPEHKACTHITQTCFSQTWVGMLQPGLVGATAIAWPCNSTRTWYTFCNFSKGEPIPVANLNTGYVVHYNFKLQFSVSIAHDIHLQDQLKVQTPWLWHCCPHACRVFPQ